MQLKKYFVIEALANEYHKNLMQEGIVSRVYTDCRTYVCEIPKKLVLDSGEIAKIGMKLFSDDNAEWLVKDVAYTQSGELYVKVANHYNEIYTLQDSSMSYYSTKPWTLFSKIRKAIYDSDFLTSKAIKLMCNAVTVGLSLWAIYAIYRVITVLN